MPKLTSTKFLQNSSISNTKLSSIFLEVDISYLWHIYESINIPKIEYFQTLPKVIGGLANNGQRNIGRHAQMELHSEQVVNTSRIDNNNLSMRNEHNEAFQRTSYFSQMNQLLTCHMLKSPQLLLFSHMTHRLFSAFL